MKSKIFFQKRIAWIVVGASIASWGCAQNQLHENPVKIEPTVPRAQDTENKPNSLSSNTNVEQKNNDFDIRNYEYDWIPSGYESYFRGRKTVKVENGKIAKSELDDADEYDIGLDFYS
ncbi:MAG TPA: hypothetical protein PLK77_18935, partial [Pyrinomonadaceae bacterium]|nr:hypothetical protein [Pyrinomonadaceae bacterium]